MKLQSVPGRVVGEVVAVPAQQVVRHPAVRPVGVPVVTPPLKVGLRNAGATQRHELDGIHVPRPSKGFGIFALDAGPGTEEVLVPVHHQSRVRDHVDGVLGPA